MTRSISPPQSHRRPPRNRRRRSSGFTLVELVIVILILGIASVIAVPRFVNTLNSSRAKSAAQRLARDVALVRSWARITSQSQSITFDTTGNTYTMPGVPNADHVASANTVALSDGTLQAKLTSVSLGSSSTTLTFNGFGVPIGLPAGGGTIGVSAGASANTVVVDPISGLVTIQ